jgi:vacuolar protein sorting-associated protein 13A/C
MQISDAWLLYKSNTLGEGFLSATLKVFTVIDDREGTEQEFKLVIGKLESVGSSPLHTVTYDENQRVVDVTVFGENDVKPVPTMLILDAKFSKLSTFVSLCVQRPQMLVALDFLLAVVEFFVPSAGNMLSNEEDKNSMHVIEAIILDQSTFKQPSAEFSLSPQRPLIVDDERFDHFIYDGNGGVLFLKDRRGYNLEASNTEAIIYVGSGKKLQFKNVVIKVLDFTYIFYLFMVSSNIGSSICLPRTLTTSIIWLV